jgi:hypothetical protein
VYRLRDERALPMFNFQHFLGVTPVAHLCVQFMAYDGNGYEKTEYMGEENIKEDIWTSGRTRNMGNKN